ncbi:hypothetical protein TorRG33x02_014010 [Trema orientale]|uniref:Uncharacterized protein n=1 Tax=Trema orientale TaxID=63057 RepID=A0A2P5FXC4_TREOI|nr:hypothetical protein TorRG33x02_014010 [Trema orientale]
MPSGGLNMQIHDSSAQLALRQPSKLNNKLQQSAVDVGRIDLHLSVPRNPNKSRAQIPAKTSALIAMIADVVGMDTVTLIFAGWSG